LGRLSPETSSLNCADKTEIIRDKNNILIEFDCMNWFNIQKIIEIYFDLFILKYPL